jgi:hypothetical protein
MEQNQFEEQNAQNIEPAADAENSNQEQNVEQETQIRNDGQSTDPSELILGKFKSAEDLTKAYQELQKLQGSQSAELGELRQNSRMLKSITDAYNKQNQIMYSEKELREAANKYSTYFEDPSFRQLFGNAYLALGSNLDLDRFITLMEGYVSSRIFAHDKSKAKEAETKKAIESLKFDKNKTTLSQKPSDKRVEDMNPKEYEEFLRRLI